MSVFPYGAHINVKVASASTSSVKVVVDGQTYNVKPMDDCRSVGKVTVIFDGSKGYCFSGKNPELISTESTIFQSKPKRKKKVLVEDAVVSVNPNIKTLFYINDNENQVRKYYIGSDRVEPLFVQDVPFGSLSGNVNLLNVGGGQNDYIIGVSLDGKIEYQGRSKLSFDTGVTLGVFSLGRCNWWFRTGQIENTSAFKNTEFYTPYGSYINIGTYEGVPGDYILTRTNTYSQNVNADEYYNIYIGGFELINASFMYGDVEFKNCIYRIDRTTQDESNSKYYHNNTKIPNPYDDEDHWVNYILNVQRFAWVKNNVYVNDPITTTDERQKVKVAVWNLSGFKWTRKSDITVETYPLKYENPIIVMSSYHPG